MDILLSEGLIVPYVIIGVGEILIPMINIGSGIMELIFPIQSLTLYHGRTLDNENTDDTIIVNNLIVLVKIAVSIF